MIELLSMWQVLCQKAECDKGKNFINYNTMKILLK